MKPDKKFQLVQARAYEIYLHRDPGSGSPEEDWLQAESEIEREEHARSVHTGPARLKDQSAWNVIATHQGHDIENPA
jgi:Protein of unknown function (DUF2934)